VFKSKLTSAFAKAIIWFTLVVFGNNLASAADTRFFSLGVDHPLNIASTMDMVVSPQGFLWMATEQGLLRYDGNRVKAFKYDPSKPGGLSSNVLTKLAWDKQGYLWIGTDDKGLNRFDPKNQTFEVFRHDANDPQSLSNDVIQSVLVTQNGIVWVGTKFGGLNLLNASSGKFLQPAHQFEKLDQLPGKIFKVWFKTNRAASGLA
jgi:ligand-binding sensor domain-containing protein